MEIKIYCIQDCDRLKYIGSTKQALNRRLKQHKYDKIRNNRCSSSKLNLDDCSITQLELCNEENRIEREKYWINKLECVNPMKYNGRDTEHKKQYDKEYNKKRKDKYIEKIVKNCLDDLITKIELANLN